MPICTRHVNLHLLLLFCISMSCISNGEDVRLSRTYARGPVSLGVDGMLHYSVNFKSQTIYLALVVKAPNHLNRSADPVWAGLGVSEETSGSMLGADIAVAHFKAGEVESCELSDRHVPFAAHPLLEEKYGAKSVYPRRDKCQDDGSWELISCKRYTGKGIIALEVKRSLSAHDDQDRPINPGAQQLIYAYGSGGFRYHGPRRGGVRITLYERDGSLPAMREEALPADITESQTLVATNFKIPAHMHTIYACTLGVLKIPKGENRAVVAMEPIIRPVKGNPKLHHLIVYACPTKAKSFRRFMKTGVCMDRSAVMKCTSVLYAWGVGGGRIVLPPHVGFMLTREQRYLLIQTHYDNSNFEQGAIDSSGVRLYFAQHRPVQAGTISLGDSMVTLLGQTVKSEHHYSSTCPSECTEKYKQPLHIFGSMLHMHTTGKKMYTNRFAKNGTFLETINAAEYWSNGHQILRKFNPPKRLNPGDKLSTTCIFDTRKKPNTKFGLATKDEMCVEFLFYYPLQKLQPRGGSSAACSFFLPDQKSPSVTLCGGGIAGMLPIHNPSFQDTVGTPDTFGRIPEVCSRSPPKSLLSGSPDIPGSSAEPSPFIDAEAKPSAEARPPNGRREGSSGPIRAPDVSKSSLPSSKTLTPPPPTPDASAGFVGSGNPDRAKGNSKGPPETKGSIGRIRVGSSCFPASATVELRDGSLRRMGELALGDEVHVGKEEYSKVFAFTHRTRARLSVFVTFHTRFLNLSRSVSLTASHLIYANGALVPAGSVRKHDTLRTSDGSLVSVLRVEKSLKYGLFNPQTLHGDIVVDGIVASTYTTHIQREAAHALLAPLRIVARYAKIYTSVFEDGLQESRAWKALQSLVAA